MEENNYRDSGAHAFWVIQIVPRRNRKCLDAKQSDPIWISPQKAC